MRSIFLVAIITALATISALNVVNATEAGQLGDPSSGGAPPIPNVAEVNAAIDAFNRANCRPPQYPPESKQNAEHGTVMMSFLVGPDGAVQESKILTSSGFARLDQSALTALSKCRMHPMVVDGKIVPTPRWSPIKYTWVLP